MSDERDIVERLSEHGPMPSDYAADRREAAAEIERLRTALRAVRASTDPRWQATIISDALREEEGT
jgi:hypothetical protein